MAHRGDSKEKKNKEGGSKVRKQENVARLARAARKYRGALCVHRERASRTEDRPDVNIFVSSIKRHPFFECGARPVLRETSSYSTVSIFLFPLKRGTFADPKCVLRLLRGVREDVCQPEPGNTHARNADSVSLLLRRDTQEDSTKKKNTSLYMSF